MEARFGEAEIGRLLAHSDWLSALAHGLVRDPAVAEDLVQDTWHAALRAPRTEVRNERGWLATLLANLARARARGEHARRDRELRFASDERIDGPDALVERAEAQRRLLGFVLALDEPYRATLLARYVEGRSAVEIARRSGVNESTVRTRLSRALAQLRERLEREAGGDRMLGLGPLCIGAHAGAAAAGGTQAAIAGIGAWIVGTTTKIGLAAAAVVLTWFAWREFGVQEPARAVDLATTLEDSRSSEPPSGSRPPQQGERQALEQAAVAAPTTAENQAVATVIEGKETLDIVFLRDDSPLSGVTAWLVPWDMRSAQLLDLLDVNFRLPADAPRELSNRAGVAAFTQLKPSRYFLAFDTAPSSDRPTRIAHGPMHTGHRYEIRLGAGAIHGSVFDDAGRPRSGVGVQASFTAPESRGKSLVSANALTNARGEYRIEGLAALDYFVVLEPDGRFDGFGEVRRLWIRLGAGEDREVDFGSRLPSPRWSGRVLNAFEEPFLGKPRLELERENQLERLSTQVGSDGKFQLAISRGRWSVRVFATGSSDAGFELGSVDLPDTDVMRDIIVPGARVQGQVSAGSNGPSLLEDLQVSLRPKGHDYPAAFRIVNVSADGSFSIDGLEPGVWVFGVWPGELAGPVELTIPEGVRSLRQDLSWKLR